MKGDLLMLKQEIKEQLIKEIDLALKEYESNGYDFLHGLEIAKEIIEKTLKE